MKQRFFLIAMFFTIVTSSIVLSTVALASTMTELNNCSEAKRLENFKLLQSQGYKDVEQFTFEVIDGMSGPYIVTTNTIGHRFEKGDEVAYSTCFAIVANPFPLVATTTLKGNYSSYSVDSWSAGKPGTMTLTPSDFRFNVSLGNAQLVARLVSVGPDPKHPLLDKEIVLSQRGDHWVNEKDFVDFEFQNGSLVSAVVTTPATRYNPYRPSDPQLHGRSQFRIEQSAPTKAKRIVVQNAWYAFGSGLKLLPSTVIAFDPAEAMDFEIVNQTSVDLWISGASVPWHSLPPNQSLAVRNAKPGSIEIKAPRSWLSILELTNTVP